MPGYKEVKDLIDTHMKYINIELTGIGTHLSKINDHLDDHSKRIVTLEIQKKPSKKIIAGSTGGIAGIIALVILYLGQALNWW